MDHPEIEDMATQTKTRDLLRQCIEDVATRDEGRQTKGAINTFVIIWCHPVLTTCPISIKHMAVDNDEWLPDWKDRMGSWLKVGYLMCGRSSLSLSHSDSHGYFRPEGIRRSRRMVARTSFSHVGGVVRVSLIVHHRGNDHCGPSALSTLSISRTI